MQSKQTNESIFSIMCEDIILREYIPTDLEELHNLTWQPEIYSFLPGWNVPIETRTDWFINYELPGNKQFLKAVSMGEDISDLMLRLAITFRETGEIIGWCCTGIKDELPAPNREIMFAISKNHRGKGYKTQATKAITSYLFENCNVEVLNAIALLHNIASNKVIQKTGYNLQG